MKKNEVLWQLKYHQCVWIVILRKQMQYNVYFYSPLFHIQYSYISKGNWNLFLRGKNIFPRKKSSHLLHDVSNIKCASKNFFQKMWPKTMLVTWSIKQPIMRNEELSQILIINSTFSKKSKLEKAIYHYVDLCRK